MKSWHLVGRSLVQPQLVVRVVFHWGWRSNINHLGHGGAALSLCRIARGISIISRNDIEAIEILPRNIAAV